MGEPIRRIVLIAEDRFWTYPKTAVMGEVLASLPVEFEAINLNEQARNRLLRWPWFLSRYVRLAWKLDGRKGTVLWLSEFKFSLVHVACARALASLKGMRLVGGPHTLGADGVLLTDAAFASATLSWVQTLRLRRLTLRDRICLRMLDIVHSYTEQYLERVARVGIGKRQARLHFPVGFLSSNARPTWQRHAPRTDRLNIAFWGVASVLHGLDLLPPAVARLAAEGIEVVVHVWSPTTPALDRLSQVITEHRVEKHFVIDRDTLIAQAFDTAIHCDLAISHLVSATIPVRAQEACDALTTNKLFEILSLGMPALVARTSAVEATLGNSTCLYATPSDSASVEAVLRAVARGEIDLAQVGARGKALVNERYSVPALRDRVAAQLGIA